MYVISLILPCGTRTLCLQPNMSPPWGAKAHWWYQRTLDGLYYLPCQKQVIQHGGDSRGTCNRVVGTSRRGLQGIPGIPPMFNSRWRGFQGYARGIPGGFQVDSREIPGRSQEDPRGILGAFQVFQLMEGILGESRETIGRST